MRSRSSHTAGIAAGLLLLVSPAASEPPPHAGWQPPPAVWLPVQLAPGQQPVPQGPPFTAQQQPVFPPVLPQQHTPPGHAGRLPGALLDPARGVYTFAPLLDPATNAVVNIAVSTDVPGRTNQLFQDPFFRRFFGLDETPHSRPRQVTAAGSGVIVDAQRGWVVTNAHVVENAARINVTLRDGRSLSARLVGRDPETDIALLELQAQPQGQGPAPGQQASGPAPGLVALPLSDSDQLRVGDVVLAIGNPFGLGQTVTSGIVSALGRSGLNAENYESYIQTDAPINPGNSGGALITSRGELAGINTAIIAPGGGNVGIGFAVPSNIVSVVVQQLAQFGEVRRGRIGIGVQTVTPRVAEALGLGDSRGVAVTNVERGSPAERAGLRPGDVVVELNGRPVQTAAELRNTVGLSQIGTQVQLTYLRAGQRQSVTLAIEPRVDRAASAETGTVPQLEGATFGVRPASNAGSGPGAASGSGSEPGGSGAAGAASREVVASEVRRNSRAWSIGLRPGDVVTAVNRLPVSSVEELRQAAASAVAAVVLEVRRGEDRLVLFAG